MSEKQTAHVRTPKWLFSARLPHEKKPGVTRSIRASAYAVWAILWAFDHDNDRQVMASIKAISDELGFDKKTTASALDDLDAVGAIDRVRHQYGFYIRLNYECKRENQSEGEKTDFSPPSETQSENQSEGEKTDFSHLYKDTRVSETPRLRDKSPPDPPSTEDKEPPFVNNGQNIEFDASPTKNPRSPKPTKSATPKVDEFFRLVRERAMKNALPPRPDKRAEIEAMLDEIEPERMADAFCDLHRRLMAKRLEPGSFIAKAACDPPLFAAHAASLISQVEGMKLAEQSARPAAMPTGAELDAQRIAALAEMGVSDGEKRRPAI